MTISMAIRRESPFRFVTDSLGWSIKGLKYRFLSVEITLYAFLGRGPGGNRSLGTKERFPPSMPYIVPFIPSMVSSARWAIFSYRACLPPRTRSGQPSMMP